MNISLPSWYDALNTDKRNDFMLTWIVANKNNLRIVVKDNKVEAYDKLTGKLMARATAERCNLEYYKILEDDYKPNDFNVRFTVKAGEPAYVLQPRFKHMKSGDMSMTFDIEDIQKVKVISVSGANDVMCTVSYVTTDNEPSKSCIVQEAVFAFYSDAVEACKTCMEKDIESWEQFIELTSKHIHYRWKLDLPVQRGEKAYILNRSYDIKSQLDIGDSPVYKETKFARVVINNLSNTVEVQTVGELYYANRGYLVDTIQDKEVVVTRRKETDLGFTTYLGQLEVGNLIGVYNVPMDKVKFLPI